MLASVCLAVLCWVGCTQQYSGTKPQTAPSENQAAQANPEFDRSRILKLRGVLRDHNGEHLSGVVGVVFAIYEQQEGGGPLWQEVQNVEVDTRGHFTALVGSTTNGGIPPELFTTEKTLWLGKQVLLSGEAEQPRMRLVSTPEGLMVERVVTQLIPAKSEDQAAAAKAGESVGSQSDQSQPPRRSRRARHQFQRPPMP